MADHLQSKALVATRRSPSSERDIVVTGLGKHYGAVQVLHDVSFTLRDGEFLTLLGPSGSGKTTSLGVIAGFVEPDQGDVQVAGKSIVSLPPRERNLGIVFQNYALFPHLTVSENVEFGLRMRKVPAAQRSLRSRRMLERVGLAEFAERTPAQLSGGQQQRVALARALIIDPTALLLDEPLGALDRRLRQQVELELKAIQRETGVAVLHVTHDQEEAMVMSDRLAVMRAGRIEQIDTPANVYKYPSTRFVADFLGEANLLDVLVEQSDGRLARVTYADGSCGSVHVAATRGAGGSRQGTVCIRPERLRLALASGSLHNAIEGTLISCLHLGASFRCTVKALGQELVVTLADQAEIVLPEPGEQVWLTWGALDAQLLADEP
ncbi:MAG: ABC transporter ATP-binding protein [Burkholderiales bacterium]|nr:ABC transporter ATP-binding protein [Burkholderiales bacterium]